DGDWYLRSALDPALVPQNSGPNPDPVYQAGVPIYEAYAGAMQGFMDVGTLQQRIGNRSWSLLGQGADTVSREVWLSPAVGLWAEIQALGGSFKPETSTTGADYDLSTWKFKAGLDMPITQTLDGTLI